MTSRSNGWTVDAVRVRNHQTLLHKSPHDRADCSIVSESILRDLRKDRIRSDMAVFGSPEILSGVLSGLLERVWGVVLLNLRDGLFFKLFFCLHNLSIQRE